MQITVYFNYCNTGPGLQYALWFKKKVNFQNILMHVTRLARTVLRGTNKKVTLSVLLFTSTLI